MPKLFNYGGTISENLLVINSTDIKFADFVDSFDAAQFSSKEGELVRNIKSRIFREDLNDSTNLSDDRCVFICNKLMVKYPDAKMHYGLQEWVVAFQFLVRFYDKSLPKIDEMIRFMNLWIGRWDDETDMTGKELKEMKSLEESVSTVLQDYTDILPTFVLSHIKNNIGGEFLNEKHLKAIESHDVKEGIGELITELDAW